MPASNTQQIMAKKKRKVFLQILAQTGKVTDAAKAVGYADTKSMEAYRRKDDDFAEAWDLALSAAKHGLEAEAWRRAHDGVLEPVYYKGKIVGYKTNYSDSLIMFLLRKLDPAYRDSAGKGDTNFNFGIAVLPMQAENVDAWEQRALEMHGGQKLIEVEAKPVENQFSRQARDDSMGRGD